MDSDKKINDYYCLLRICMCVNSTYWMVLPKMTSSHIFLLTLESAVVSAINNIVAHYSQLRLTQATGNPNQIICQANQDH